MAISRRDGSCIAHCANQVEFAKIIAANNNAIAQLVSDKCNQNIEQNHFNQATSVQDRMSQSVHEARNQIFDEQEMFTDHNRKKKRSSAGGVMGGMADSHNRFDKILPQLAYALDINFGVLWVFDAITKSMMCYNVIASEMPTTADTSYLKAILSPELALPLRTDIQVTRNQASLNILACLDILTSGQSAIPRCFEQVRSRDTSPTKESQNSDYQLISRFDNFGGGWGYSGHSVEAIRFMADADIVLYGFAMFGGRGEYTCKLKLYDLGLDDGIYEEDEGILISETEEIPYECPARSKYNIMLPKPLTSHANRWYLVWARISGPSSDCGSSGQSSVTTEDQIVFNFKTSKKANNGTDINSGQIPSILYRYVQKCVFFFFIKSFFDNKFSLNFRIITHESKQPIISLESDPVYKISRLFANTVNKECFESLVQLLNWAWGTFKNELHELKDKVS